MVCCFSLDAIKTAFDIYFKEGKSPDRERRIRLGLGLGLGLGLVGLGCSSLKGRHIALLVPALSA